MNPPRCRSHRRINAISVTKMILAMQEGPSTAQDLVEASGLSLHTCRHYILTMHREGAAHITAWERAPNGAYRTPAYALGAGRDVSPPKPISTAERSRLRRAKQRLAFMDAAIAGRLPMEQPA